MGNASSQEEANGTALGGFLGLLGSVVVSVICPPVAVIVIPAGFATHTYGMATIVKYDRGWNIKEVLYSYPFNKFLY